MNNCVFNILLLFYISKYTKIHIFNFCAKISIFVHNIYINNNNQQKTGIICYILIYNNTMNTVTIRIGNEDLQMIDTIFENEADFQPRTKEDKLIVEILKQIKNNPKVEFEEYDV